MMFPYIITFIFSYLFLRKANKRENIGKKGIFFELIALAVLSFLAAIRDSSVGTDVKLYVEPVFELSKKYGFSNINYIWYNVEVGYKLLNCFVSTFTSSFSVYLFIQQYLFLLFSLIGIKKINRENYSFTYLIFLFLFYNMSLNIVRQSMAIGLSLCAIGYLLEDDIKKFFPFMILAFFFHKSAIILLLVFFMYMLYKHNRKKMFSVIFLISFVSIMFAMFFPYLVKIFSGFGILNQYMYYIDNFQESQIDFNITEIVLDSLFIVMYLVFSKIYKKNKEISVIYFMFLIIDLSLLMISSKYAGMYRLGMYFRIPAVIFFMSNFGLLFKKNSKSQFVSKIVPLILIFLVWYIVFVGGNSGNTIPFKLNEEISFFS